MGTRPVREIDEDLGRILGLQNHDGELLEFAGTVKITETIEQWLKRVEFSMKFNVARTIQQAHESFNKMDFKEWIKLWPTQFLLIVLQIDFTASLTDVFDYVVRVKAHEKELKMATEQKDSRWKETLAQKEPRKLRDPYGNKITTTQAFKDKKRDIHSQINSLSQQIKNQLSHSMR